VEASGQGQLRWLYHIRHYIIVITSFIRIQVS